MRTPILYFIGFLLCIGCASNQSTVSEAQQKEVATMVTNKSFEIDSQWAYPLVTNAMVSLQNAGLFPYNSSANMIDITGHNNYFIMKNDSVKAFLPYYGERQMGGAYNRSNSSGIEFNGVPRKYRMEQNKKGEYIINFSISDTNEATESYRVSVTVYNNKTARIYIFSSSRLKIEYRGKLKALEEKT